MIDRYAFGSIIILGTKYTSDLKIIDGQVHPDWWRKSGHTVDVAEIADILNAKPDYLIIGSGSSGMMKLSDQLKQHLIDCGVNVIEEPTSTAIHTFNQMYADEKNVAAAFHLTC
jgi:hypothetical protein